MVTPSSRILGDLAAPWTVKEVALLVRRKPKTIRNLIWLHNLTVSYGRQPVRGKRWRRRILLLPPETVQAIRRLTQGG